MKSREGLIRARKFEVDDKRQTVMQLELMIEDFKRLADDLTVQIEDEQKRAGVSDVNHFNYPPFAKAALQRRDNLQVSIDDLDEKLEVAKTELNLAIEELKSVENIDKKEMDQQHMDQLKAEQDALDDRPHKISGQ